MININAINAIEHWATKHHIYMYANKIKASSMDLMLKNVIAMVLCYLTIIKPSVLTCSMF